MDFTPPSNPPPVPIQACPISSFPSSTKLPIKRKNPNYSTLITLTTPKLESTPEDDEEDDDHDHDHDVIIPRQSPFKSHRIWTEPDEIRLLQGLLDCCSQGLSFPRDLGIFYAQFVNGMSQPYSKSQLSEKLRRLRKKFRVISSRISKGLDKSLLSPQDRALYDLSKQLWDPDHSHLSLGGGNSNCKPVDEHKRKSNSNSVSFSPCSSTAVLALPSVVQRTNNRDNGSKTSKPGGGGGSGDGFNVNDDVRDVNVELEGDVKLVRNEFGVKSLGDDLSSGIVHFATTTLAEVLDQSLKEMRVMIDLQRYSNLEKEISFEKRWREQHVAEFDVLAKRLKLIVERSSMVSK